MTTAKFRTVDAATRQASPHYGRSHLLQLEAEAIYVIREVAAQFERPVLLFSGGKDSIVMAHLARRAFWPGKIPFPLLHIDTGHNFPETLEFRDRLMQRARRTPDRPLRAGLHRPRARAEETGPNASRNALQTVTLLDAMAEFKFEAALGGARRDEEKARAKERFFSHRDRFGQWDPKNQRPELWKLYNGRSTTKEHFRVFPLSNWTEMDIWQYIALREHRDPVALLLPRAGRQCDATACCWPRPTSCPCGQDEQVERQRRALPHHRRHDLHRRGRVTGRHRWTTSSTKWPPPA